MAMRDAIGRFQEQFAFRPTIENALSLQAYANTIVCGMGGSHLGPWLIREYGNHPEIVIHRDYGLPKVPASVMSDTLVILSSHSGNTEEVLDSGREALARGLPLAAVTTGGKLAEFAREHAIPHVVFPHLDLQPRVATALSMISIAALMRDAALDQEIRVAGGAIDAFALESDGARIAQRLYEKLPVIYASSANMPLAAMWKIKMNETGKVPAFYNVFPEMNHNELCGFDVVESTRGNSANVCAVFLEDPADHPRIQKRMQAAAEVLTEKGILVERVQLQAAGLEKAFRAITLADWVALSLAGHYGVPDEDVPVVEDFKRRIAE
jgi:glucose/mannose-6-phosphate isomerase